MRGPLARLAARLRGVQFKELREVLQYRFRLGELHQLVADL